MRRRNCLRLPIAVAVLTMAAIVPRSSRAQDPEQLRARLAYLQQQESIILAERNWWLGRLRDPDSFLLPADPNTPWTNQRTMPRFMRREDVVELSNRFAAAYIAMRVWQPMTAAELMADAEQQNQAMKQIFEQSLLPAFERDLQAVRDEFHTLMGRRTEERQAPPIAPAGRAWYFRRPVIGADITNANFTLIDSDADERGGYLQVRGKVVSTDCYETWKMSWKFGQNVSRLQQGMQIPVTLDVQLTSAPCPSANPSMISVGGGTMERLLMNNPPSPVMESAFVEVGERAAADGRRTHGTASAVIRVERNPGQSNAWTLFRLQVYMPGQFWVVGYLYLAGGS